MALPFGLGLGALFAWASRVSLQRASASLVEAQGLTVSALFSVLVFVPVCGYFLAFEPDWCFAYLFDTQAASAALVPAVLILVLASVPAGFALAARVRRHDTASFALRLAAICLSLAAAVLLLGIRRFAMHASYAQFHGDFGVRALAGSSLGYAILLLGFWLTVGVAFTLWSLRRFDA